MRSFTEAVKIDNRDSEILLQPSRNAEKAVAASTPAMQKNDVFTLSELDMID